MASTSSVLVTGGAGFIGSAVVRHLILAQNIPVINVDKLTYAGRIESLGKAADRPNHIFIQQDITDMAEMDAVFEKYRPARVLHLAAESHVDRSIDGPADFIETNIIGTYVMLEASRKYWATLPPAEKEAFRFHHVSTDEVFGDLGDSGLFFTEKTAYAPSSPYSASKASSDHLVRSWGHTYGLPVLISNCSNNYGPYHFPEKLIPLMITNALAGKPLPVYGNGEQIRDWLYVDDHVRALWTILNKGKPGETYNVGGNNEMRNIDLVWTLCGILDELAPVKPLSTQKFSDLITFVADRPGHDRRYAIDSSKLQNELGWQPRETVESGLRKTVTWFLENRAWWQPIKDGLYQGQRLGMNTSPQGFKK